MDTSVPTVLISEATRGVGYEISKNFARNHFRMIIVGSECATLHNVSEILKTLGAPVVHTICKDLSIETAPEEIFRETSRLRLGVDILINNIVTPPAHKFSGDTVCRQSLIVHQNVVSVVKMTSLYLGQMLQKGKGIISQVVAPLEDDVLSEAAEIAAESFALSYTKALMRDPAHARISFTIHSPETANIDVAQFARQSFVNIISHLPEGIPLPKTGGTDSSALKNWGTLAS